VVEKEIYCHKGGDDDGYGGKTLPITWKEEAKDHAQYETWAMNEMKKACEKIKAHPKWDYGENAYPSPYERAIVAGCGQAVEELQRENSEYRSALEDLVRQAKFVITINSVEDLRKWVREWEDVAQKALEGKP
jgi:hypothetical protein